jgi:hypothetical protein
MAKEKWFKTTIKDIWIADTKKIVCYLDSAWPSRGGLEVERTPKFK